MRSAPTIRPAPAASPRPASGPAVLPASPLPRSRSPRRRAGTPRALLGLMAVLLLAGCASGTAEEARRGQERDAEASAALPRAQATHVVGRFFKPTPTPTKAPPAPPTLERLEVTTGLFSDNAPQGNYASVPADAGTVYVDALLHGLRAGHVLTATLTDAAFRPVATAQVEIDADAEQRWVALPFTLDGSLPPGEYAVFLFAGERRLNELAFTVSSPGSGSQMLPDPPANPRVDQPASGDDGNPRRRREDPGGQGEGDPVSQDPNIAPTDPNAPAEPNVVYIDPNAPQDPNASYEEPVSDPGTEGGEIVPVTFTP